MSLVHDIIKMKYVDEGYLPNYPFHLISDVEMCDAFLPEDSEKPSFFWDNYPCLYERYASDYNNLVNAIRYHLEQLRKAEPKPYILPDWVYSYMIGSVIGPESATLDIHDMLVLMSADNIDDIFSEDATRLCLEISNKWINKLHNTDVTERPPTIFGEPHVIKSLRLMASTDYTA